MTLWEWKVEIAKAKIKHLLELRKAKVAIICPKTSRVDLEASNE